MGIAKRILKAKVHVGLAKRIVLNNIDIAKQTMYRKSLDLDPYASPLYKEMIDERIQEAEIEGKALRVASAVADKYVDTVLA